jgi:DNA-binding NtrC family response regulator
MTIDSGTDTRAARRRVLVVDDDPALRSLLHRLLDRGGFEVHEAVSGRNALALLHARPEVECIVTDLRMDDGSGGWFLAQVAYDFPQLLSRTLVISGDAGGAGAAHIRARWQCPVLAKPFTAEQLIETLDRMGVGATGQS